VNWFNQISLPVQSETSLAIASEFLAKFDEAKIAFDSISGCSLNIPKMHALQHYAKQIPEFGSPDNFDTEYTEHQHIADAKIPYVHTNKRDHVPQMIRYNERKIVLETKKQYLENMEYTASIPNRVLCRSLGSRAKNSPIFISAGNQYGVKNLKLCIRNFLHNKLFPDGEGSRHRVKKRNLPELESLQVFIIILFKY
jgi:hypothetical protein